MSGPRARLLSITALGTSLALACVPVAQAQPREEPPPPPVVQNAPPPPPVVDNVPPPPVVQNAPPPPVVQNAPPPPAVVEPVGPQPPVPPPRRESSTKTFMSALGMFVLSYGLTVLAGAIRVGEGDSAGPDLYIPIVGPPIFWANTDMHVDAETGAYLVLSTLLQTVGLAGTIVGFVSIVSDPAAD